jgi:hypothetical protein
MTYLSSNFFFEFYFRHTYIGIIFHWVAYRKYDIPQFIEHMDWNNWNGLANRSVSGKETFLNEWLLLSWNICCNVLPSNASLICGFWILYLDLLCKSSGGITIKLLHSKSYCNDTALILHWLTFPSVLPVPIHCLYLLRASAATIIHCIHFSSWELLRAELLREPNWTGLCAGLFENS